jgi:hypothetical protein
MKSLSYLLVLLVLVSAVADTKEVPEVSQPVNKNEASDADKAHAQQPPQPVIVTVTEAPKTPNQIAEERAYRAEEAKLQRETIDASKELARYTLVALILSLLVGGIAAVQAVFAKRSADAAKQSANTAERTLVATNRPWVDLEIEADSELRFVDGSAQMTFRISATNVGDTPAINCDISAGLVAFPKNDPPVAGSTDDIGFQVSEGKLLYRSCRKIRTSEMRRHAAKSPDVLGPLGFALFPKNTAYERHSLQVPAEDIAAAKATWSGIFWLAVVASVDYQFPFTDDGGITGKILTILRVDPTANGGANQFTDATGIYPIPALAIRVAIRNGIYAA